MPHRLCCESLHLLDHWQHFSFDVRIFFLNFNFVSTNELFSFQVQYDGPYKILFDSSRRLPSVPWPAVAQPVHRLAAHSWRHRRLYSLAGMHFSDHFPKPKCRRDSIQKWVCGYWAVGWSIRPQTAEIWRLVFINLRSSDRVNKRFSIRPSDGMRFNIFGWIFFCNRWRRTSERSSSQRLMSSVFCCRSIQPTTRSRLVLFTSVQRSPLSSLHYCYSHFIPKSVCIALSSFLLKLTVVVRLLYVQAQRESCVPASSCTLHQMTYFWISIWHSKCLPTNLLSLARKIANESNCVQCICPLFLKKKYF